MTSLTKAVTFPTTRSAKNPSTSQRSRASTCDGKDSPEYFSLNRAWSNPSPSNSFPKQPEQQNAEDTKISTSTDAQYLSPMERWEKEDLRQSQWNNIASFVASATQVDHVSSINVATHRDNSSMKVNIGSEK